MVHSRFSGLHDYQACRKYLNRTFLGKVNGRSKVFRHVGTAATTVTDVYQV